jgi:general secretion pathway protein G
MNKKGFTLIELMIVISIIGILSTLAQPSYVQYRIRAKEASLKHTLFVFRDVVDKYYADHGKYPDSLENLAEKKYIRSIPKDPFTKSSSTWVVVPSEEEESGIYDIHSGSYKIGLNGVPYNEW